MKKIIAVILVALALAILLAGHYFQTHISIDGEYYPRNTTLLDLQETPLSLEQYEFIRSELPDCEILWNVPFQGKAIPNQSRELTVSTLAEEDLSMLSYFPMLEQIHAEGCDNYSLLEDLKDRCPGLAVYYTVTIDGTAYPESATELTITSITDQEIELLQHLPDLTTIDATGCDDLPQIMKLRQQYPGCELAYVVPLEGKDYSHDTTTLSLSGTDPKMLLDNLCYLPMVTTVNLTDPVADSEALSQLLTQYPDIRFHWEMEVMGVHVTTDDTEVDFSEATVESIEAVETAMACFPNIELVYMGECGIDYDELAAYRDRVRDDYKVAWLLRLGKMPVRTDDTSFMPGRPTDYYEVTNEQMDLLRYCEDMICIDIGHYVNIVRCDWVANMSKLKYLIIADTSITDLTPLSNLKELVFLEVFLTHIRDVSPLLGCTSLEELNLCYTAPDPEPIKQMTGLTKLWWARSPLSEEEFKKYLPNTRMMFEITSSTGLGWREGEHYYAMRDALGMFYMFG